MTVSDLKPICPSRGATDAFARYCDRVATFCPFIRPAADAGVLLAGEHEIDAATLDECHARLFERLVPQIEAFRRDRRQLDRRRSLLLCHNLIVTVPPMLNGEGQSLLDWPCWLLKQIYTDQGILFGMFWKGEEDTSRNGSPLPLPPVHFVSIRSKVAGLDRRFFGENPHLLQAHIDGRDDGQNVHAVVFGTTPDLTSAAALKAAGYYRRVRQWGEGLFAANSHSGKNDERATGQAASDAGPAAKHSSR